MRCQGEQHDQDRSQGVHDLHVWEITSQFVCLSAHVVVDDMDLTATRSVVAEVREALEHHFSIAHSVIEVEPAL